MASPERACSHSRPLGDSLQGDRRAWPRGNTGTCTDLRPADKCTSPTRASPRHMNLTDSGSPAADPSRQTGWPPRQATMWPNPGRPFALLYRGEQRKRWGRTCAAKATGAHLSITSRRRTRRPTKNGELTAGHPCRWRHPLVVWQVCAGRPNSPHPSSPPLHARRGFTKTTPTLCFREITLLYCQRSSEAFT